MPHISHMDIAIIQTNAAIRCKNQLVAALREKAEEYQQNPGMTEDPVKVLEQVIFYIKNYRWPV